MEFKDRIRRAREAAGLTQAELAERVSVDKRTVRNWEAGRVPRNAIGAIERALGIDLSDDVEDDRSPRLATATDAQLLASLADRLAERDRKIAMLTAELAEATGDHDEPAASARWAARLREADAETST